MKYMITNNFGFYCREVGILKVSACFLWDGGKKKKVKSWIFLPQRNSRSRLALPIAFRMINSMHTSMVNGMPLCFLTSICYFVNRNNSPGSEGAFTSSC